MHLRRLDRSVACICADSTGGSGAGGGGGGGEAASRSDHAVGTVDDDVRQLGERLLLLRGRADQQRRQPRSRRPRTASNASRSPRSSPATAPRRRRAPRAPRAPPALVHARGADLQHHPAGLEASPCRSTAVRQPLQPARRPPRRPAAAACVRRPRGPSPPRAPRGVLGREQRRELVAERLQARGRLGGPELAGAGVPVLVAVLPHDASVAPAGERVGDRVEAAELDDLARRATGHDDRAHAGPARRSASRPVGVDHRREGSATIGESVPSKSRPTSTSRDGHQGVVPSLALVGAELHAATRQSVRSGVVGW